MIYRIISVFLLFSFYSTSLWSQCDSPWNTNVLIITTSNDTIDAYVKNKIIEHIKPSAMDNTIPYKIWLGDKCKRKEIKMTEINEINRHGKRFFSRKLPHNNSYRFLQLRYEGTINYYRGNHIEHHTRRKDGVAIHDTVEVTDHYIQGKGGLIHIPDHKKDFVKKMKRLFGKHGELIKKIENYEYTIKDMEIIIQMYSEYLSSK